MGGKLSTNFDIKTKVISLVGDGSSKLLLYTTTQWAVGTIYALNARVRPTATKYKSRTFKCTTNGTSHATTEPTWPDSSGSTVTDGTVTWTEDSDDYDRHILGGLDIFSKDYPHILLASITGDGTYLYATPTGWLNEFSQILSVEFPIGESPPCYLSNDRYEIINTATGTWKILLKDDAPSSTQTFKVRFTAQRDATVIPAGYIEAFHWLVSALACTELSTVYVNTTDSSINADASNPFAANASYADRAAVYMQMYKNYMGIGDGKVTPSLCITQSTTSYPYNIERLTHPRIDRRSRNN